MKKQLDKKEMASTFMAIGCFIIAFLSQSVILGFTGVAFGLGTIISYKQHKQYK